MKKLLLIVVACVCLVGCGTSLKEDTKKSGSCGDEKEEACKLEDSADMSAYENFQNKENQFVTTTMKEVLEMIENKDSGIVYFGFPSCPWCVEALPIMNEAAKEKDLEIYYVQTRDEDRKQLFSAEEKERIMAYTDAYLDADEDGVKQFYVPFVIVIQKGEVLAGHIGTVDGYDTHERKMNDAEKKKLKDLYVEMFEKLQK